ncbi:hypothetical protein Sjap_008025 [Stephania japonica]|uniref:Uncharacterized protein n=1 Tax=Stephania japonica TaxID=461633 RepID=A0AAP0JPL1_9MAGN
MTMTLLPSTTSTTPVMAVVPRAPTMYGTTATTEAKQWREFKRHDPVVFYGGTNVTAAELFPKSNEKIHHIIATEEHMKASISSSMLMGEADDWWTTIVSTRGIPRDRYIGPQFNDEERAV